MPQRLGIAFACIALLATTPAAAWQIGAGDLDDLFDDLTVDAPSASDEEVLDDPLFDDELDALLGGAPTAADVGERSVLAEWKGYVELKPRAFLRSADGPNGPGKNDAQLLFESELELDFRFTDDWTGKFRPRILLDALDDDLERFEPFEAWIAFGGESWDLRAGQMVENWGVVDTYNPLDVLNRRDFATDPLDADRLGELGVRFRRTFAGGKTVGEPTVALYAMPAFRETRFGTAAQRLGLGGAGLAFDEAGGFEPAGDEQAFFALRFASTLDLGVAGGDVQFVGARGPARLPVVVPIPAGLSPVYYGAETLGVGLRAVPSERRAGRFLSTLTLKAEVAHTMPYAFDSSPIVTPEDYTAWVAGVDRSFYGLADDADELTLTVEHAHESGANDAATFLRPFGDDLILRGFYSANDFARQSLELRALVDLDADEQIYELLYERQLRALHEDLKLTVQLQVFDSDPATLFGQVDDPSSIALALRWDA